MTTLSDRYSRQMMLAEIGPEGQRRIMASSVLVIGLGGLGCPATLYLAGAGVGCLGLADYDVVSVSNLHRQLLYCDSEVGTPKTETARRRLSAASPSTLFNIYPHGINRDNAADIISQYDLVLDCCDNYATRYLVDDTCAALGKTWIFASLSGYRGMVSVFSPESPMRYGDLFADREELSAQSAASGGVIGPTAGVIGSVQAAEAVKILAGNKSALDGRLLSVDLLNMDFNTIDL